MRIRARTISTTLPAGGELRKEVLPPGVTGVGFSPTVALVYDSVVESMSDELPLKQKSGVCVHSRTRTWYASAEATQIKLWYGGSGPLWYDSTLSGSWLYWNVIAPNGAITNLNVPISASYAFDWKQSSYEAVKQMRETLNEGLLLPNFLRELAESGRQLHVSATRRIETARIENERQKRRRERSKEIAAKAQRKRGRSKRPKFEFSEITEFLSYSANGLKQAIQFAATANLVWQFAVRPTLDDAKKLASLIGEFESRLSKLIDNAGKRRVAHYARPIDNYIVLPPYGLNNIPSLFNSAVHTIERRRDWKSRPKYHASMLYTYDASALKGQLGKLRGLIHAFGVDRVGSILWEALPFSFVIDWFVNVGDMIRSVEDHLLDPLPIVIHDFNHSLKYSWRISLRWNWNGKILTDIAYRDYEYYERRRDIPSLWDSLSVRTPNLNQVGLGLSLIVVRMDGNNSWRRR
jgi:hypothetical protein